MSDMESILEYKNQLRKEIRQKKKLVDAIASIKKARVVFAEVETLEEFKQANIVLAFWSLPDEIPTHEFVMKWGGNKKIVLPVVIGDDLELRLFEGVEQLEQSNQFGIMEPKTGKVIDPQDIEFAIIPGVAFDGKGNRLGRGRGFYDRLMPHFRKIMKVGVGYEFQLVDSVPVAEFDLPVDMVICN
jgi:5-formyltetrahydrofolate cyclo-ligase